MNQKYKGSQSIKTTRKIGRFFGHYMLDRLLEPSTAIIKPNGWVAEDQYKSLRQLVQDNVQMKSGNVAMADGPLRDILISRQGTYPMLKTGDIGKRIVLARPEYAHSGTNDIQLACFWKEDDKFNSSRFILHYSDRKAFIRVKEQILYMRQTELGKGEWKTVEGWDALMAGEWTAVSYPECKQYCSYQNGCPAKWACCGLHWAPVTNEKQLYLYRRKR